MRLSQDAIERLRTAAGLAAAAGVAWIGSLVLGEYPFRGVLPIAGGFLLGISVVATAAFIERGEPPRYAIAVAAALAVWGEWRAAWIDAGGIGPLPAEAWYAMAAAAAGALMRLVPARERPSPADDLPPDDGSSDRDGDPD